MDARSRKHSEITQTTCDHHRSSHVLAPSVTKPSPRMKGCCRPRLTASCCCCCGCDSSPGVRVHTAHDDAPGIGTIECARSQHAPPGLTPRSHRLPGSRLCRSQHAPPGYIRSPGLVFCLLLVEHLRDLVSEDRCGIVRPHAYPRTVTSAISSPPRELGPAPALQQGRNQYTHADATAEKTRRATPPIMSQRIKSLKSGGGGGDGAGHFGAPPYGHVLQVVAIVVPAG